MSTIFRLLIVEDEPWIRKSLEKILPWEDMGIEFAGCARNGEEAFGMIANSGVDLVITDIKMPKMDGFALMDKLSEHIDPAPKYLIISGYDDFQYAKNAIKQGVMDYILKPIDPDELKASVLNMIQKLNMEKTERDSLWKWRLKDYIHERVHHPAGEVINGLLPEYAQYCLIFSIHPVDQELMEKWDSGDVACFSLPLGTFYVYFILSSSEEAVMLQAVAEIRANGNPTVGMSGIRTGRDHSFYQALKEAENDYLMNVHSGVSSKSHLLQDIHLSNKDEIYFLEAFQSRDKEKIRQKVGQLLSAYTYFEQQWVVHFQLCLFFGKYLSHSGSGMPQQVLWLHELKNMKTLNELEQWRHQALDPTIDEILNIGQKSAPNYYLQAVKYIEDHYSNASLSLEAVARHLNLSAPYLSNIFNSRGGTYTSYVTGKRVEKAKQLLLETELTVSEVSEAVGFNDVKYFIHVFKKETLYTPNNFRKLAK